MSKKSLRLECPSCGALITPAPGQSINQCPYCRTSTKIRGARTGLLDRVVEDVSSGHFDDIGKDLLDQAVDNLSAGQVPGIGRSAPGVGALQRPMEALEEVDSALHVVDTVVKKRKKKGQASGDIPGKSPAMLGKAMRSIENADNILHIIDAGVAKYRQEEKELDRDAPAFERYVWVIPVAAAVLIILGTCVNIVVNLFAILFHSR